MGKYVSGYDFKYTIGPVPYHIGLDKDEIVYEVASMHQTIPMNQIKEIAFTFDDVIASNNEFSYETDWKNLKGIGQILISYSQDKGQKAFSSIKIDFADPTCQNLLQKIAHFCRGHFTGTLTHQQAKVTMLKKSKQKERKKTRIPFWNNFFNLS